MHEHTEPALSVALILAIPFIFAAVLYLSGVSIQARRGREWPWYRSGAWVLGVSAAAAGFAGPLADAGHSNFVAHMSSHLLVGMIAPLLLVLAAPVTLALRTLRVTPARRLSRVLLSWPARISALPIVGAVLSVGGLWLLYRTDLYAMMQQNVLVHLMVTSHFLLAGYLFTVAIIPVDPAPHRAGYRVRLAVLVLALASHGILAKLIYSDPPAGVDALQGQAGAMLMYYAGDVVHVLVIGILFTHWYREAGRELRRSQFSYAQTARRWLVGPADR
ncbi:cytochrome c oxidase assembly protein [Microbacterium sp.]|uniref:cytochrome c oxidase assembly protein n=1 Tax=Microbacterium sp. TaxID=51671 RepID=UPI002E356A4C|nr:cytochrome c oxidase assembly protein [Microbacterium sp.]HEX5730880.1 cytochrome c oxidase assembly protein [Microbacterium sp.]